MPDAAGVYFAATMTDDDSNNLGIITSLSLPPWLFFFRSEMKKAETVVCGHVGGGARGPPLGSLMVAGTISGMIQYTK